MFFCNQQTRHLRLNRMFLFQVGLIGFCLAGSAKAAFLVTIQQVGPNVVATGTGSITIPVGAANGGGPPAEIVPSSGKAIFGVGSTENFSLNITGPGPFGTGSSESPTSESGSLVGMFGPSSPSFIFLPTGYVSNSALSDTTTWAGATFTSLGITPGTYTYTLATNDTFTITASSAVPEPASLALIGIPAAAALLRRRRKFA